MEETDSLTLDESAFATPIDAPVDADAPALLDYATIAAAAVAAAVSGAVTREALATMIDNERTLILVDSLGRAAFGGLVAYKFAGSKASAAFVGASLYPLFESIFGDNGVTEDSNE